MEESLNKTIKIFSVRGVNFEIDELLDQRDWDGEGSKLFDLYCGDKCVASGITSVENCYEEAKIYLEI